MCLNRVADEELTAFEELVAQALERGDERGIEIIGYGEVTTVLAMESSSGPRAVKRVPPFAAEDSARRYMAMVERYIAALEAGGVRAIETHLHRVDGRDGKHVVYCVQPALPFGSLAPDLLRGLGEEQACAFYEQILAAIEGVVCERLAPDGQLSNWAFYRDRLVYIDVSTPFMRDESGNELLDWEHQLRALPAPIRPVVRRWIAPQLLDKYYTLRGQVVDLLGNLIKEHLEHLTDPYMRRANERFEFTPTISQKEIRDYYSGDARAYAFLQSARRADRWWQRSILRRTYPYFLPPPIDRNTG